METYLSRITFYDIVGYLLPGMLSCSVLLLLSSGFTPSLFGQLEPSVTGWVIFFIASYFMGHITQGLAMRAIPRNDYLRRLANSKQAGPADLSAVALRKLRLNAKSTFERYLLIDSLKIRFEEREIFIARQGFYRGSSFACLFASISFLMLSVFGHETAIASFVVQPPRALLLAAFSIFLSIVFLGRYKDFIAHELQHSIAEAIKERAKDVTP